MPPIIAQDSLENGKPFYISEIWLTMKERLTVLLLFLTLASPRCHSQQMSLSDQAEISVLTLGPWQGELFTAFGHSAFRVHDPVNGFDAAYNYGVFDFDQPNFYLNFAMGNNLYMLGVMSYPRFEYSYIADNRYIHEQILNLSAQQKKRLFDFLQWNALPENRAYYYDYFYDNCATKIPEVMIKVFGDSVIFDGSYIKTNYTIRELTDLYLDEQPWGDLGIDIGLGLPTDKKATPYEHMFLPDYVESGFAHASIVAGGKAEPLVRKTNIIYQSHDEQNAASFFGPLLVFSLFLVLTMLLTYFDMRRKKASMFFDKLLFTVLGALGICLVLLWVVTNHHAAAKNFNLLWALPTHIIAVVAFRWNPPWLRTYFLIVTIVTGLLLIAWPIIPQKLHYSLIPLVIAVGLRAYTQYRIRQEV